MGMTHFYFCGALWASHWLQLFIRHRINLWFHTAMTDVPDLPVVVHLN
jgi:hypothetical protein